MNLGVPLSRRLVLLAVLAVAWTLSAAVLVFWNASRVLDESDVRLRANSEIPFSVRQLDAGSSTQPANADGSASPALYRDAAILEGHIYLIGPTGIWEYADGSVQS